MCILYPVLPHTRHRAYIQNEMEFPQGFQTCLVTLEPRKVTKVDILEAKIKVWHPVGNIWEALGGLRGGGSGFRIISTQKRIPLDPDCSTVFGPGHAKGQRKLGF